jgi:hypothetical protein
MVLPLDETIIGFGEGRIAKNTGVVNRINSVQAARDHTRLAPTVAIRPSHRRRNEPRMPTAVIASATKAIFPLMAAFLPLRDATRCESRARGQAGKRQGYGPDRRGFGGMGVRRSGPRCLSFGGERQSNLYSLALSRNIGPKTNTSAPCFWQKLNLGQSVPSGHTL